MDVSQDTTSETTMLDNAAPTRAKPGPADYALNIQTVKKAEQHFQNEITFLEKQINFIKLELQLNDSRYNGCYEALKRPRDSDTSRHGTKIGKPKPQRRIWQPAELSPATIAARNKELEEKRLRQKNIQMSLATVQWDLKRKEKMLEDATEDLAGTMKGCSVGVGMELEK
ncbi:MAG: hypothetical protein M1828_006584 [Chrysothrix sp. TS-e1954]|nr:MAG: hypothetical protein M1828_006584 [Chrysothrix sp. TS-e1954]